MKLKDYKEVVKLCTKVLEIERRNVKALYRRAQAYIQLADLDFAESDINKALEIDLDNRDVKLEYKAWKEKVREYIGALEATKTGSKLRSTPNSFDGRKIHVGECALFQARNAPPFIGIIRRLIKCTEDSPKLGVNWLYRPTDLKLAKGNLLDAAPNEVFYSFHKDVIPAASLLHLCKVAFLPNSVELPLGIPAFVCRRVYDIANKHLWWLTDQDYTNEHQEEVDQLLNKTRLEMHIAVQSGGHSPKSLNNTTSNQQLKSGSDSVQSSGISTPQSKGMKRSRNDQSMEPIKGGKGIEPVKQKQGIEPIKRQHSSKLNDGGFIDTIKSENIKAEINKMADKGGIVSIEGVGNLVSLMQVCNKERKIDLAGRIMLADVIAAMEKSDSLHKFVQLKGVTVLDDWLQEVHKGKNDKGSSPCESESLVEDFLLSLLRALEKLPISLNTLQSCNIGKSVNNLRSYKNLEIQKRARGLVDTWKKRVDTEMSKVNDRRSVGFSQPVSLPDKPGHSDVSQTRHKRTESTYGTAKMPNTLSSASKLLTGKPGTLDYTKKIVPAPVVVSSKDLECKTVASSGGLVLPPVAIKEENNSGSYQSHSNDRSCSSDQEKFTSSSQKEETKSSATALMNTTKLGSPINHNQRSSNGLPVTNISGDPKETHSGRFESANKVVAAENALQGGLTCQKPLDVPIGHGNINRLVVRLPNPGQSLGRNDSGISVEDPLVMGSNQLPSGMPDKQDRDDGRMKRKSDVPFSHIIRDDNTVLCQGNEVKDGLFGNGEVSSPMGSDEEHRRNIEVTVNFADPARSAYLTSGNENGACSTEPGTKNSYSSMHALEEGCAKYSEPTTPLAVGDDTGMNLLASVDTGEISQFDIMSQINSVGTAPAVEEQCTSNDAFSLSCDDDMVQKNIQYDEPVNANSEMQGKKVGNTFVKDLSQTEDTRPTTNSANVSQLQDNKLNGHQTTQYTITCMSLFDKCNSTNVEVQPVEERVGKAASVPVEVEQGNEVGTSIDDKQTTEVQLSDICTCSKPNFTGTLIDENISFRDDYKKMEDDIRCTSDGNVDGKCDTDATNSDRKLEAPLVQDDMSSYVVEEVLSASISTESLHKPSTPDAAAVNTDSIVSFPADNISSAVALDDSKILHSDHTQINLLELPHEAKEDNSMPPPSTDEPAVSAVISLAAAEVPSTSNIKETENSLKSFKESGFDAEAREDNIVSSVDCSSSSIVTEPLVAIRLELDLNEVIPIVEGNQDQKDISSTICSSAIHLPTLSPFTSHISTDLPAKVTVAAPTKRYFVPPQILLMTKGEPGWKGSAATSAFRPAEPQKISKIRDMVPSDGVGKKSRPLLDIDLNIPDEEVLAGMASQSSIQMMRTTTDDDSLTRTAPEVDLHLNRVDEGLENGQSLASTSSRLEVPLLPMQPASGGLPAEKTNVLRNFDLNDRPDIDGLSVEAVARNQQANNSTVVPNLSPVTDHRTNSESGYTLSWFRPNPYPVVAVPSLLPDRGDKSNPVAATAESLMIPRSLNGVNLRGDIYCGTSSPAMLVSPATPFPYPNSSFPPTFTLAPVSLSGGSTHYVDASYGSRSCFPAYSSLLAGPAGAVSSNYPSSYMISFPEGGTSAVNSQDFDLNTGPGCGDMIGKDEKLLSASRQLSVATSRAFMEDQARMYDLWTVGSKRKEPEGSWDAESTTDRSAMQVSWK
ncbi:hypothetical protein ZIOFF_068315 [Zingiber officinale]|uniref:TFIIS N-terminal domain-containing protein n=1 Tax=Zingiber officinale TaxID=94328 RepID=A0A8J5ET89_ZINOF|nr:hypothetical protein ZIOFF_068315 [Zingiber officinale]